jgi:ABC-type branched-subunit amino acid transport system substrate-binding protein
VFVMIVMILPKRSLAKFSSVKIGVVFSKADWNSTAVKALDEAVEMINKRDDILPHRRLLYSPIFSDDNTFKLTKAVCSGIEAGFRAVIGPSAQLASLHVQSICHGLDIPHLDTTVSTENIATPRLKLKKIVILSRLLTKFIVLQASSLERKSKFSIVLHPSYAHSNKV